MSKQNKVGSSGKPEYLWLECATCNVEFDIIIFTAEQIDEAVRESGHDRHRFELCDYEPEHDLSVYDKLSHRPQKGRSE